MFDFVCRKDTVTKAILNPPHSEQPYGYSNSNGQEGYLTLVNCCEFPQAVSVSLEEWAYAGNMEIQLVYQDGQFAAQDILSFPGALSTVLSPESVVVYHWKTAPVKLCPEGFLKLEANSKDTILLPKGADHVAINWMNIDGTPFRTVRGIPDGFRVSIGGADTQAKVQDTVWSGVSWVNLTLQGAGVGDIAVTLENNSSIDVIVRWRTDGKGA
jgi:hypothetical protein